MNKTLHILPILLLLLGTVTPTLAQTITGNVYGGGNLSQVEGSTTINIKNGGITAEKEGDGNIYGGGYGASAVLTGNTTINVTGGSVSKDVYGGGALANVTGSTTININGGTVTHDVYGGGALANVGVSTTVSLTGGTIRNSYGGGLGSNEVAALVNGDAAVTLNGSVVNGSIFGCNNLNGAPQGIVTVTVTSGTVNNNVYGGGNQAAATVNPIVNINGGTIKENVYGGGYGATAVITGNPSITVTDGTISQDVYGGGALANVTGSTTININGGTVTQDVYGGGALANVSENTSVNLNDGSIRNSYGGGLGSNEVAALVNGNATVTLGKLQDKADPSDPDVYTASKVTGSIFGANNINGTPKGHVKVHILKTTPHEGQTAGQYDVAAVYGGGNQAAYEPTNNEEKAEVIIENCDNSIAYVYGGGNAAPVPATDVKIYGANAIDNAFAGGNGYTEPGQPTNPGADIGYRDYTRDEGHKYGAGTASITIYGGTVNNVFGGSNTLGYIAGSTSVNVTQPGNDDPYDHDCDLNVGKVFGGGNEADINCNVEMNCNCSKGVELLYAGANNADVNGNITLNIYSGTYGQVFCGNNQGGAIRGSLKLNVDETGCWPVMIGELYGGGYGAPYSVYGYNDDKSCKESGEELYNDPTVNLISFTRIGKVFGGGYGEKAKLYGTTKININPIKGVFAGQTPTPEYVLNANDERVAFSGATSFPVGLSKNGEGNLVIPDAVGTIGTIYGGGNAGNIIGNTEVNIGTVATNKHISGSDLEDKDVTVSITGNVYGGGNVADVTGQTNVKIGKDK